MQPERPAPQPALSGRLRWGLAALLLIVVAVMLILHGRGGSPVPPAVRQAAGFTVYYPDPAKLPPGYELDRSSFRQADPGVIVYSVTRDGQRLAVSEEAQPGGSAISDFLKNYIPLHTTFNAKLGQAQIGAYGSHPNLRTVVSLPITKGPWLIMTAPDGTSQADLKQIIQALRK